MKDKILTDINSYNDIVSDLKDVWYDLNAILDYEDDREKDVLDGFMDTINGFEQSIIESAKIIEKEIK